MPVVVRPTIYDTDDFVNDNIPIVVDDVKLNVEDTLFIFGRRFDKNSVIITITSIIILNVVYMHFGYFQNGIKNPDMVVVYLFAIVFLIGRLIMESDKYGGFVYEQESLLAIEQMNSLLLGSLVIIIYFGNDIVGDKRLLRVSLVLLLLNSLNIAVIEDGDRIKTIRTWKEGVLNFAIFLIVCSTVVEYNSSKP